jgi:hypothetical protein
MTLQVHNRDRVAVAVTVAEIEIDDAKRIQELALASGTTLSLFDSDSDLLQRGVHVALRLWREKALDESLRLFEAIVIVAQRDACCLETAATASTLLFFAAVCTRALRRALRRFDANVDESLQSIAERVARTEGLEFFFSEFLCDVFRLFFTIVKMPQIRRKCSEKHFLRTL